MVMSAVSLHIRFTDSPTRAIEHVTRFWFLPTRAVTRSEEERAEKPLDITLDERHGKRPFDGTLRGANRSTHK